MNSEKSTLTVEQNIAFDVAPNFPKHEADSALRGLTDAELRLVAGGPETDVGSGVL